MQWRFLFPIGIGLFLSPAKAQTAAVSFDASKIGVMSGGQGTYGWDFTVTRPIRVTALGVWDSLNVTPREPTFAGDGMEESHTVGLWMDLATTTPLATAVLPAGTEAAMRDTFRYVPIPPIDLAPGQRYVIGANYAALTATDDVVNDYNPSTPFQIASPIVFGARRFGGPPFVYPASIDAGHVGDFGPNFLFTEVPEPSTMALSILAAGAFVFRRLRNR